MIVYFGDDIIVKTRENLVRDGETNTLEGEQILFYKKYFFWTNDLGMPHAHVMKP